MPDIQTTSPRIPSIDIIRGLVMVLMAIDHVRVYSGQPAGGPEAAIFFTRWITHFCAPAFAFLAGTSAFLYGRKLAGPSALARSLATRGLILVILELTLIRWTWTFTPDFSHLFAGVIWMLGWCMVLLAPLVFLQARTVGAIGLAIIAAQQLFGLFPAALPASVQNAIGGFWEFIYPANLQRPANVTILYVLVPWIGVMALGYGFGLIAIRAAAERRRLFLQIGLAATALFLLAGLATTLMTPAPSDAPPLLFRLLNQRKYPASQLFLLMTLGPTLIALALVEYARGWFAKILETFGRVPLFYYLLHIPVIHVAALAVTYIREGATHPERYQFAPFTQVPPEFVWPLPLLYLVFLIVVAILYAFCRSLIQFKSRARSTQPNRQLAR